ncbi:hypothetical protein JCM10296v2_000111 [Rhodotorula toruloides]
MADDTRTLNELLAELGPARRRFFDRPDFVDEEERRALALELIREREEGRRLYWREEIASLVDCFGCTPDSSLRDFLNALEMTGHPRIDGGVYLKPSKAVIGAGHTHFEKDKDRTLPTVLAPTKPFLPTSLLIAALAVALRKSLNALFNRVGRQDVLDQSLLDLIASLPEAMRLKALNALMLLCCGLSSDRSWHSNRTFDEYDHATPKLLQLIAYLLDIPLMDPDIPPSPVLETPTSPAEQLAQYVFGRIWSCGGQVSLTIVMLLDFSELKANQLLDFVRRVSERSGSSTGDTVLFDFSEDNIAGLMARRRRRRARSRSFGRSDKLPSFVCAPGVLSDDDFVLATIPPFDPSDFDIAAALLTAEAAARSTARNPADLPPVFARPARLKREGNLAVYRATCEGVELVLKTHNVEDALEREACMYERLEEAMGKEGVLGSERITPIVVGRFYSTTDAQDMIMMEYGGEVMSRWIEKWTLDQRQQALRLLERLRRAGVSHNNVHGQNFVLSPEGTVRLIDLEHAQAHTGGGECHELKWFGETFVDRTA